MAPRMRSTNSLPARGCLGWTSYWNHRHRHRLRVLRPSKKREASTLRDAKPQLFSRANDPRSVPQETVGYSTEPKFRWIRSPAWKVIRLRPLHFLAVLIPLGSNMVLKVLAE